MENSQQIIYRLQKLKLAWIEKLKILLIVKLYRTAFLAFLHYF